MKIVIAPDSFKESAAAPVVAEAMAAGILEVVPDARIDLCPMADGGEGTVDAIVAATAGQILTADVFDPLGAPIRARFALIGQRGGAGLPGELGLSGSVALREGSEASTPSAEGQIAVIEMAAASGLALVPPERRDPLRTTSFGTGQLIISALDAGAREIIIGIGGSGTVDGGSGAAQALGVVFTDGDGRGCVCGLAGGGVGEIEAIDLSDRDPRISRVNIRVACDVANPLLGPEGAARTYAPQKGATLEVVEKLEANLTHLAGVIKRELEIDVADVPGGGAAGGLGAGLLAFASATLEEGFATVAEAVGLGRRLSGADLCLTGEGRFDAQTRCGKVAAGVGRMARIAGVPAICIPGQATPDAPHELFAAVRPLVGGDVELQDAMSHVERHLKQRTTEAVRSFLKNR